MKIRTDFVTNSSSSSFVLAFKDATDLRGFYRECEYRDCKALAEMVKTILNRFSEEENRKNAEKQLRWSYEWAFRKEMVEKHVGDFPNNDELIQKYEDYVEKVKEYTESEEYKKAADEYLTNSEYAEKKRILDESEIVLQNEIWDTDGGLLEWAIRNGFLEDVFRDNCLTVWNVG